MPFTDFTNGISSADDYLSSVSPINAQLTGSVSDISRLVISAQLDANLKEIICSLLAGRGLKLPNIQICLSLNLKELLGLPLLQQELYDALNSVSEAFDRFLDHTKIEEVLGRINNVLAEVTNIANMINFCSSPIDPISIPNVLTTSMQSFLGTGKGLIDRLGTIVPDQIGGCLIDGEFNTGAFSGGILGSISDNYAAVAGGTAETGFIDAIATECAAIATAIDDLIDEETSVTGTYDQGGSDLAESARTVNDGVGVLHNASDAGIQGNTRIASQLKALYDNFGSYQVVGDDGTVYNNIFETFVEPDLLRVLRYTTDPSPEVADSQPVFNYCGEVIGYTKNITQETQEVSVGTVPELISLPGFNAGGLITDPITEGELEGGSGGSGGTTVNNITNVTNVTGSTVYFADSESAQLALNTSEGDIVYRTDIVTTYLDNGGTTGTMSDFFTVGVSGGGGSLNTFLTNVNVGSGTGFLTRSGDTPAYRTITGTVNQISVSNGSGTLGNPTVALASNLIIPGADSVTVPIGTTGQRVSTTNGALRYNTTTASFEGYQGGAWLSFATGSASVTGGANVGGGTDVFFQNNAGTLEFNSLAASGAITIGVGSNLITIGDSLTGSNLGGTAAVYAGRNVNNLQFKGISSGNNTTVTENVNDITIDADTGFVEGTTTTTDGTLTEILFDGIRPTPTSGKAWFFDVTVVAKRSNGVGTTAIKIEGLVDNSSGTVTIVGTAGNKTIFNSTATTVSYDLTLDVLSNQFRVRVNGAGGHNVNWSARYRYQEA